MQPFGLGVVAWWLIAVLVTATFLVLLVPWMPTRSLKIQASVTPVAMALFGWLAHLAKHYSPAAVLAMYSLTVLVFPVGMMGHRKETARRLLDREQNGATAENEPPRAMTVQMCIAATVLGGLAVWITL
ncbi:hypothetical protein ACWDRR_05910 [Kitasatospora sp. NPDC003701]